MLSIGFKKVCSPSPKMVTSLYMPNTFEQDEHELFYENAKITILVIKNKNEQSVYKNGLKIVLKHVGQHLTP